MDKRKGDWQQTFRGAQFWALDPRPEEIDVRDIAHALALQCRFAGACRVPYSVAEHSVRVSRVVEAQFFDGIYSREERSMYALGGLLHDASEAYCVDVPRPLKPHLAGYREIEHRVTAAVEEWAGLPDGACSFVWVKNADEVLLMTEKRDLMAPAPVPWTFAQGVVCEPLAETIVPWTWQEAEERFLARYHELRSMR